MRPPEDWKRARVTLAIAALTALAWILAEGAGRQGQVQVWAGFNAYRFGADTFGPGAPVWLTPLTCTLVHAGFAHLAMNLVILLFCGRPVENVLGPAALAILYVVGAYAAAGAQYLVDPASTVPMVGASGAISAVLGGYAMLFGRNKIRVANPTAALWLNALWLCAGWIGLQLLIGLYSRGAEGSLDIAIAAHIGGFLAGIALARPLLLFRYRKA
jgi:membrane associated rhomboid family serine protease